MVTAGTIVSKQAHRKSYITARDATQVPALDAWFLKLRATLAMSEPWFRWARGYWEFGGGQVAVIAK